MSGQLNAIRAGTGRPVALLHPVGLDLNCWDRVATILMDGFQVIRLDLPGHGASPLPGSDADLADYATAVKDALKGLGAPRAHVVGLSFGGMVAQTLAIDHPEVCASLVLAGCPSTFADKDRPARVERGLAAVQGGMQAVVPATLDRWFTAEFLASGGADSVRQTLLAQDVRGWRAAWGAISRLNTQPLLHTIGAPTLCIAGVKDRATDPETVAAISRAIPGARFMVLPDAPHMMQIECAEAFSAAVGAFVHGECNA